LPGEFPATVGARSLDRVGVPPVIVPDSTMQIICRLIELSEDDAASLVANPSSLAERIKSSKSHSDVYRYWHAIEYLLAQQSPGSVAANWLTIGTQVSESAEGVPAARVLMSEQVQALDAAIADIQPDDLITHYDAVALDAAGIYPGTWQEWEEDFDPLGQVLEHYFFLQQFASRCAQEGAALLLQFDLLAEGSV
jgi:hypothetical protein